MTQLVVFAVFIFIALIIGFYIGKMIHSGQSKTQQASLEERVMGLQFQLEQEKEKMQSTLNAWKEAEQHWKEAEQQLREAREAISLELTRKQSELQYVYQKSEEQKKEVEQLQEKFTKEFENLANKILDEKTVKFTEQNKENLKNILTPLQEKIQHFEKKVEDTHKESIDYHAALRQQIVGLKEMNEQMSKETLNLTKALKGDSKMQGNWGELILERVLEKSGLEKGREYEVQQSHFNQQGSRVYPDVIINLPDGKKMVVDSKVSLSAYERYTNEEDETLRAAHLKEHIASIKRHVDQLSDKNYHDLYQMESPDFVLLFIPIESAFAIALNEDNSLYNKAFEKNIVIVTPTTLLATLRTIDSMWTNQKQQENALEIARQAGALYDKFEGFIADLLKIGKKMDEAKADYSAAMNKLVDGRGNLVHSVEKLRKMGAKSKKMLPDSLLKRSEIDEN